MSEEAGRPLDPDCIWILSRQAPAKRGSSFVVPPVVPSLIGEPSRIFNFGGHLDFQPQTEGSKNLHSLVFIHLQDIGWAPWQLWDGRYWMRVKNRTSNLLVVRSLLPTDIAQLRDQMTHKELQSFEMLLKAGPYL